MNAIDLIPRLAEQNGEFICKNLKDAQSEKRYRVPIVHRSFRLFGETFDHAIKTYFSAGGAKTAEQLAAVLKETGGVGLFAAKKTGRWVARMVLVNLIKKSSVRSF